MTAKLTPRQEKLSDKIEDGFAAGGVWEIVRALDELHILYDQETVNKALRLSKEYVAASIKRHPDTYTTHLGG